MSTHWRTDVKTVAQDVAVGEAAVRMEAEAIGSLVVVDERKRAVGIVTDRDITIRVVAGGLWKSNPPVAEVMSQPLITASPDDPLDAVLVKMHSHGIRRVPIVKAHKLMGIVALDDLLVEIAEQIHDLAVAADRELRHARRAAAFAELRAEFEEKLNQAAGLVGQWTGEAEKRLQKVVKDLRERLQRAFGE